MPIMRLESIQFLLFGASEIKLLIVLVGVKIVSIAFLISKMQVEVFHRLEAKTYALSLLVLVFLAFSIVL